MKNLGLIVLGLTLGLGLAFATGRLGAGAPNSCLECEGQLENLRNKFENLSEVDIQEYLALKEQKARYEKADEILGKILTIFLADLGIRVSQGQLKMLKAGGVVPGQVVADGAPSGRELINSNGAVGEVKRPGVDAGGGSGLVAAPSEVRPKPEDVGSVSDLDDFFKKTALKDPTGAWKSAKGLTQDDVQTINGTFIGSINFDSPPPSGVRKRGGPWRVQLETRVTRVRGSGPIGQIMHLMWNETGKRVSRTASDADSRIKNFRSSDDGAILIDAYGGDMIIQVFYFSNLNEFAGVVYEKGTELGSDYQRVGVIHLQKR